MSLQLSKSQESKLKILLGRAFTKKQLIILESSGECKAKSITSLARVISEDKKIPLSTVKLDLKILEQLDLLKTIETHGLKKPRITKFGQAVIRILFGYNEIERALESLVLRRLMYLFSFDKL